MKYKKVASRASESDQKADESHWSSKRLVSKGQVVPLFLNIQTDEADLWGLVKHLLSTFKLVIRALIARLMFTGGLVIAIVMPLLVFAGAVNSLLIFGSVSLIYVLGGSLGALIMKVRKTTEATSILFTASSSHQAVLIVEPLGTDEKAA